MCKDFRGVSRGVFLMTARSFLFIGVWEVSRNVSMVVRVGEVVDEGEGSTGG